MDDIKERLIATAQDLIQRQGFNGFSYRDIAAAVGIRSASIHYHFPTKADLGAAVAARYTDDFMARLQSADQGQSGTAGVLRVYASLFKEALADDGKMCLCGILSAEVLSLPPSVAAETKRFFDTNIAWLEGVFAKALAGGGIDPDRTPRVEAALFLASLEGAMLVAKGAEDPSLFDAVVDRAIATASGPC